MPLISEEHGGEDHSGGEKLAQGEFTKEEGKETLKAVDELFEAIPKTRQMEYLGHLNDICLFINAAIKSAPEEKEGEDHSLDGEEGPGG